MTTTNNKKVALVVACTHQGGFAANNAIPWRIKADLSFFRSLTLQTQSAHSYRKNAVIMGRTTWETLPPSTRPLPNRLNIVISSTMSPPLPDPNIVILPSLQQAIELVDGLPDIEKAFVIGGQRLYEEAIAHPRVTTAYITLISSSPASLIPVCDRHFPLAALPRYNFSLTSQNTATEGSYTAQFMQYDRHPIPI